MQSGEVWSHVIRRMIDLSATPKELHHWVRLNKGFQSDHNWWAAFLEGWNGVSLFGGVFRQQASATVTSDASGSWGCGAYNNSGAWFQFSWPELLAQIHITTKELLPIIVVCAVWGQAWQGKTVCCWCDNAAVVAIIRSGSAKDPITMHLMRCLFFFTAAYNLVLEPRHVLGRENITCLVTPCHTFCR